MTDLTLIPIQLPPGVWKNGTRYQAKGRFFESNRIRWHDGALRHINGWERRSSDGTLLPPLYDPSVEAARDIALWRDNLATPMIVFGTNRQALYLDTSDNVRDISPAALTDGLLNPTKFRGYGVGDYGEETYGTPRAAEGIELENVARWSFDYWGENLLALPDWLLTPDNVIYEWVPDPVGIMVPVVNCPQGFVDFVVTDDYIVMGIGADGDPRKVSWSHQGNNTDWVATDANQAGDQILQGSGKLTSCHNVLDQVLILSEKDAHVARYIGPPFVYDFDHVGDDCSPAHKSLVAVTGNFAVWVGHRNFWIYDGTLRELPCDVIDHLQESINSAMYSKAYTWVNGDYTEVWWCYVSNEQVGLTGEPDVYIKWNWQDNAWDYGSLDRVVMADGAGVANPIAVDHQAVVYWHEVLGVLPEDSFAITGPLEFGQGERNMAIRRVLPDVVTPAQEMSWQAIEDVLASGGNVGVQEGQFGANVQFMSRQMPTGDVILSEVYELANPTQVRVLGRDIMMRINGTKSGWEVGNLRFDIAPAGVGSR